MPKNEFIGFRIELLLQQSLNKLVKTGDEFKSITEAATRALSEFIAKYDSNEIAMTHPDYPDLLKIVAALEPAAARKFVYELMGQIAYDEVSAIYGLLTRFNKSVK